MSDATTSGSQGRLFLAGATGVIGSRLVGYLLRNGWHVAGMTRSADKAAPLAESGAEAVVCDVYDRDALLDAVARFRPNVVMHQLTDLPDALADLPFHREANGRIRTEGTRGVVVRYGQFYGPGTFYEDAPPEAPRVHVDVAARRTVELVDAPSGIAEVVDETPLA